MVEAAKQSPLSLRFQAKHWPESEWLRFDRRTLVEERGSNFASISGILQNTRKDYYFLDEKEVEEKANKQPDLAKARELAKQLLEVIEE